MNILGTVWTLYPRDFFRLLGYDFLRFYCVMCAFWAQ